MLQRRESKKKYSIMKFNAANNVDFTKCAAVCIHLLIVAANIFSLIFLHTFITVSICC